MSTEQNFIESNSDSESEESVVPPPKRHKS